MNTKMVSRLISACMALALVFPSGTARALMEEASDTAAISEAEETSAETSALSPEEQAKWDQLAMDLKQNGNPISKYVNVHDGQPKVVLWTKGIRPPEIGEGLQLHPVEDTANGKTTQIYQAAWQAGQGWYDVNKNGGQDANLCFASAASASLHWWLDQNAKNIKRYQDNLPQTPENESLKQGLNTLQGYRYTDTYHSDIFQYFITYYGDSPSGNWPDILHDHFINGYPYKTFPNINVNRPNDPQPSFGKDGSGFYGFFNEIFGNHLLTSREKAGSYANFSDIVKNALMDGKMIMPTYSTTGQSRHVITLWGAEYDLDGNLCGIFVTDSDNSEYAGKDLFRYTVYCNHSDPNMGEAMFTEYANKEGGSYFTDVNLLSLGDLYWKQYFGEAEKPLTLTWSGTSFPYDGQLHAPQAVISGAVNGDVSVAIDGAQRDAGKYTARATLEGADASKYSITNATQSFSITPAQTSVTVTADKTTGMTYELRAAVNGAVSGEELTGTVTFSNGRDLNQTVNVINGSAEISWSAPDADQYTITATFTSANQNYTGSADSTDIDLSKKEQTTPLNFGPIEGKEFGNDPFALKATGGDGTGALEYVSSNHHVITIQGTTATIVGAGDTEITATKSGDDQYNSQSVTIKVSVAKAASPKIDYPTAGDLTYGKMLGESALNGGSRDLGDFAWADPNAVPGVGTANHTMTFTPNQLTEQNYAIIERSREISVTVTPSTPTVALNAAVDHSGDASTVTLSANVNKVGSGETANDGTVTFLYEQDGSYVQIPGSAPVTVQNGMAQFVWTGIRHGQSNFKAQFNGSTNYAPADSSVFSLDTTKPPLAVHPITVNAIGNGTASADPASAAQGTVVKLTATPADGARFKGWKVLSGNVTISNDRFTMPDAPVTIQAVFEKEGSSGGGGGTIHPHPNRPESEKKPNSSSTQTTRLPDGSVVKETNQADGSKVFEITTKNGASSITTTTPSGKTETQVSIPENVSKEANEKGEPVSLPMPPVTVQNGAKQTAVTIDVGRAENAKVSIPVDKTAPGVVAVKVNPDGTREVVRKSIVTENGVVLTANGVTTLELEDRSKAFGDVNGHWASDAIAFVSSRNIFNGTSASTFSPNAGVTRGMLVKGLHNLEGNPLDGNTSHFSDVAADAWFADSVQWAVENGIVMGFGNNQFAPEKQITRAELAVMLYRYAGSPAPSGSGLNFSDADQIGTYAHTAISWAVENGIITGTAAGTLDPNGTATRAQTSVMLMRFMNTMIG